MTSAVDGQRVWRLLLAAWVVALAATLGALFIGEVLGQAPCVLCWFQRVFMFPLAVVLAIGCFRSDTGVWRYALPLAAGGWLIALYHTALFVGLVPEGITPCDAGPSCSDGDMSILGQIPIPVLSLVAFSSLIGLLLAIRKGSMS